MLVKIHKSYRYVVAICDSNLIGKEFEDNHRAIKMNPHFFQGDEKTEEEVLEIIENAEAEDANFNIVGKQSIATALKTGIIKQEGITEIKGIPIALVLL